MFVEAPLAFMSGEKGEGGDGEGLCSKQGFCTKRPRSASAVVFIQGSKSIVNSPSLSVSQQCSGPQRLNAHQLLNSDEGNALLRIETQTLRENQRHFTSSRQQEPFLHNLLKAAVASRIGFRPVIQRVCVGVTQVVLRRQLHILDHVASSIRGVRTTEVAAVSHGHQLVLGGVYDKRWRGGSCDGPDGVQAGVGKEFKPEGGFAVGMMG
jgi:hypothetical protein